MGLATTYRHVKALAEQSVVVGVDYPGQPTRYEWVDGQEKTHFTCRGCDKLFALNIPQTDELPDSRPTSRIHSDRRRIHSVWALPEVLGSERITQPAERPDAQGGVTVHLFVFLVEQVLHSPEKAQG